MNIDPTARRRSDCAPGLTASLIWEPETGEKRPIPDALLNDLIDWCAERGLFGGFKLVTWNENGEEEAA